MPEHPQLCFDRWDQIPFDHPEAIPKHTGQEGHARVLQSGFYLSNDGGAAHDITVEEFEIEPSVRARSKPISRIAENRERVALVWLDGYAPLSLASGKWDLLGAMAKASEKEHGTSMHAPDFVVPVCVKYRDSNGIWYRSQAELTYIRSQNRLEFGPTTQTQLSKKERPLNQNDALLTFRTGEDPASPGATRGSPDIFKSVLQRLKVQLRREQITPEGTLSELRAIADDEQYPVNLRARIVDDLDRLSGPSANLEDSASDGLRAALRQKSEKIRRDAVVIILERIMAPPEIRDYEAAKRYHERVRAMHGGSLASIELPESSQASSEFTDHEGQSESAPTRQAAPLAVREATPKQIVDRAKLKHKIRSYEKIAARIGISKDTLYAITEERRWVSDHTYELAAEFCKCKPEDLHPSGIPSRK